MESTNSHSELRRGAVLGVGTGLVGTLLVPPVTAFFKFAGIGSVDLVFVYTAGSVFGLVLALYVRAQYGLKPWQILVMTLLTPAIYYAATQSAIFAYGQITIGHEMMVPGFVGGAIGAGLVSFLTCLFLRPSGWLRVIVPVILAGAVCGTVALPLSEIGSDLVGMFFLHVPWHAAVLAVLLSQLAQER